MRVLSFLMTISLIGGMMLAGCAKKAVTSKVLEEELKAIPKEEEGVVKPEEVQPVKEVVPQVEAKKEVIPPLAVKGLQDIFFDYDRFYIRDDTRPILETNAEYLKANKDVGILIEGHCDERGTSEYNIALGERRAQATKRYLVDLGIDPSRISTISYGKERPFCTVHNEGCWQENRRAHFVVR